MIHPPRRRKPFSNTASDNTYPMYVTTRLLSVAILLCVLISLAAATLPAAAQGTTAAAAEKSPGLSAKERQLQVESFEYVWKAIRDKHYDPKLGGLDWEKVRDEFRPKIEKADSQGEVRQLLGAMLRRLKQSHLNIIPGDVYDDIANGKKTRVNPGDIGIDVRIIENRALVISVAKDGPAYKLGVRSGWEIVKAGGEDVGPVLEKVRKASSGEPWLDLYLARAVMKKLQGEEGAKVKVVFRDERDCEKTLDVSLGRPRGKVYRFGNLPAIYVDYESRKLAGNVAYFRLNAFADPPRVMPAFEKTVLDNLRADGFVLDLRGNPGGLGIMAVGFGNWFVKEHDRKLGTLIARDGKLHFILNRRPKTFEGPLAILVDGLTASTSEILAGGLQDLGRAKVFGTTTAGAALPSVFDRLPNGDGFQYVVANYISASGKPLEGRGVRPDVEVRLTRDVLLQGRDAVLEAALAWIRQANKGASQRDENVQRFRPVPQ